MDYRHGAIRLLYQNETDTFNMGRPHFHDEYELYYLQSGSRLFFIKDRVYPMVSGCLAFVDGGELHRAFSPDNLPHSRFVACIRRDELTGSLASLAGPFQNGGCIALTPRDQYYLEGLIAQIIEECEGRRTMKHYAIELMVKQMLLFTLRHSTDSEPEPKYGGSVITRALSAIDSSYAKPISLSALCADLGVSPSHFTRIFKASTGFTLVEYIHNLRLKKAAGLLSDTDFSVSRIAEDTGFQSFSYFGKKFRNAYGLSPLKYRQIHGKVDSKGE